jgi:hypothetical protein
MEAHTHYIPSFTRVDTTVVRHDGEGRRQTICGTWVWPEQHQVDPARITCWGCKAWIENLNLIEKES